MTKKEFIVEVISTDGKDTLLWQPSKRSVFNQSIYKKELIRCKDCIHLGEVCNSPEFNSYLSHEGGAVFEPEPDFYCPFGKRKEE